MNSVPDSLYRVVLQAGGGVCVWGGWGGGGGGVEGSENLENCQQKEWNGRAQWNGASRDAHRAQEGGGCRVHAARGASGPVRVETLNSSRHSAGLAVKTVREGCDGGWEPRVPAYVGVLGRDRDPRPRTASEQITLSISSFLSRRRRREQRRTPQQMKTTARPAPHCYDDVERRHRPRLVVRLRATTQQGEQCL